LARALVIHVVKVVEGSVGLRIVRCSVRCVRGGDRLAKRGKVRGEEEAQKGQKLVGVPGHLREIGWHCHRSNDSSLNEVQHCLGRVEGGCPHIRPRGQLNQERYLRAVRVTCLERRTTL